MKTNNPFVRVTDSDDCIVGFMPWSQFSHDATKSNLLTSNQLDQALNLIMGGKQFEFRDDSDTKLWVRVLTYDEIADALDNALDAIRNVELAWESSSLATMVREAAAVRKEMVG